MINRIVVTSVIFLAICRPAAAEECKVVRWDFKKFGTPYIPIREPGKYCLDRDYFYVCYPWDHGCMKNFLEIYADDVDLDMKGHKFTAINAAYTGIVAKGRNISLRNGSLIGTDLGIRVAARDSSAYGGRFHERGSPQALSEQGDEDNNLLIENMKIVPDDGSYTAIQVIGGGTVIRNNSFDGLVWLQGKGILFEQNRVRFDIPEYRENHKHFFRHVLLIRNAPGIRLLDNQITVGGDPKASKGIEIWDTPSAVVQRNIVTGAEKPLSLDNSFAIEDHNTFRAK